GPVARASISAAAGPSPFLRHADSPPLTGAAPGGPVSRSVRLTTSRYQRRLLGIVALVLGCVLVQLPPIRAVAAVNPCGPPGVSVIACENTQPGDPTSDWQVPGTGDASIQRSPTPMSAN